MDTLFTILFLCFIFCFLLAVRSSNKKYQSQVLDLEFEIMLYRTAIQEKDKEIKNLKQIIEDYSLSTINTIENEC